MRAAQAVQRSAYPDAYAAQEADATRLVDAISSAQPGVLPADLAMCLSACPQLSGVGGESDTGAPCTGADAVLIRAATWLTAWNDGPVPYLSSADPSTWLGGYRRDCSGYASMALGLPGPGLSAQGLADRSTPITETDLRPGDLLINPAPGLLGHVVIFDHWTDATMSSYVGYEQSGDGGTHHRTIPYPYFGTYPMTPYRYGPTA